MSAIEGGAGASGWRVVFFRDDFCFLGRSLLIEAGSVTRRSDFTPYYHPLINCSYVRNAFYDLDVPSPVFVAMVFFGVGGDGVVFCDDGGGFCGQGCHGCDGSGDGGDQG